MEIGEWRDAGAVVLSLVGRLDGIGALRLEARVLAFADGDDARVVLDCEGMTYLNSAGLRALLIGAKMCHDTGKILAVAALRPQCLRVLEVSGLLLFLDCHETAEAALAALDRAPPDGDREGLAAQRASGIEIEERTHGPVVVIALKGRLDAAGASDLETRVSAIAERGEARVVLDCEGMTNISSAGLRAFVICAKTCREKGRRFTVAALQPECRSVIDMSGFRSVIEYHATSDAARAAFD